MKILTFCFTAIALTACGVDGAPVKPEFRTSTTVGVNSKSGPFTKTSIGVVFDGN